MFSLFFAFGPAAVAQDDERDIVMKRNGDEVRGRILERYNEEEMVVLQGTKLVKIPRRDVHTIVNDTRTNLRTFLSERKPGLSLDEEWALVARADQLGLPRMGNLQAWHVLTLNARHEGANERLGHRKQGRVWKWRSGRRWVDPEEFEERITVWRERLVLESENYHLETNTNIELAVNALFDLERSYTFWMDTLGAELQATEVPVTPIYRMKVLVFADQEEPAYPRWISSEREPFYAASEEYSNEKGDPNVIFTHASSSNYPTELFELAAQQLLYTTLRYGRRSGDAPNTERERHAYWAEIGVAYWMGSRFGGTAGYARAVPFRPNIRVLQAAALRPPRGSALSNPDKELPNLINLPFRQYHTTEEQDVSILRAKAMTFFTFLLLENPPVQFRGRKVGDGRDALFHYLRAVYSTPRGHSSSAFDDAIKPGKIEGLRDAWAAYLAGTTR